MYIGRCLIAKIFLKSYLKSLSITNAVIRSDPSRRRETNHPKGRNDA